MAFRISCNSHRFSQAFPGEDFGRDYFGVEVRERMYTMAEDLLRVRTDML